MLKSALFIITSINLLTDVERKHMLGIYDWRNAVNTAMHICLSAQVWITQQYEQVQSNKANRWRCLWESSACEEKRLKCTMCNKRNQHNQGIQWCHFEFIINALRKIISVKKIIVKQILYHSYRTFYPSLSWK